MKTICLYTKPVPINQKYGIVNGRNILSKAYRNAKDALAWEIRSEWKNGPLVGSLAVNIIFYYGDNRHRDIDAYIKILLDAMEGIVYENDYLIDELHVFKEKDITNPRTEISIV